MGDQRDFDKLLAYLRRVPAISPSAMGTGKLDDGNWWVKFSIDVAHPLAWHVVQEFGCVLNYLSVTERLPTVFMPVSPAPYLNGGVWNRLAPGHAFPQAVRFAPPAQDPLQWRKKCSNCPPETRATCA